MAHKQLELPLAIAQTSHVRHDPYWDELEKDDTVEPNTNIAPEHSPVVLEQVPNVAPEQITPTFKQVSRNTATTLKANNYVLEQVKSDTNQVAPEQKHWTEIYTPSKRKNYKYYRYCYMEGRKLHHIHISGGNIKNGVATARWSMVENAIASGRSPLEIKQLIALCKGSQ